MYELSLANALRFLSVDMIRQANSGHPGAPLGMADMATVLWNKHLKHNPRNPHFINRDRFILSNGHASALLYSLLHLTGYDLSIEDLKKFRQYQSKTPGHPEFEHTPGVETTTGPLGQGLANAVGMALAEKLLSQEFNMPNFPIIDHYTYVFVGDGCLMEGISHEVCSLAGTLKLGKLIVLYDDNHISIDGNTKGWFDEDVPARFRAYGWQVIPQVDGHHMQAIDQAIEQAKRNQTQPTLICCQTVIGKGAGVNEGSARLHGAPLSVQEIANMRTALSWTEQPFVISDEIYAKWDATTRGEALEDRWRRLFADYQKNYPKQAVELLRRLQHRLPDEFAAHVSVKLQEINFQPHNLATRKASQNSIEYLYTELPELLGGSADLTPSNLTDNPQAHSVTAEKWGNYIHYGVREFGMSAMMNGIFLHGGWRPLGATFLVFSDYARNAIRMAALMKIGVIFIFTHDSIGVGEDGPTHQPIEHLASLRLIPGLNLWRPCDAVESFVAWIAAIESIDKPTVLVFTRQDTTFMRRNKDQLAAIKKGAYVLLQADQPQAVIVATGSEVQLAMEAQKMLQSRGIQVNVVSMPSSSVFDEQSFAYQKSVLPTDLPRMAVEAGSTHDWYRYVGREGRVVGIDHFGASAPADQLFQAFEITVDKIVQEIVDMLS